MDTPTLESRIRHLQNEVAPYSNGQIKADNGLFSFIKISETNLQYIGVFLIVLIILALWRPSFVKQDEKNKDKISYKKFFISWLLASFILTIGIFAYNYKKE